MNSTNNNARDLDLNVAPISFEALMLALLNGTDNDPISRLKREIKTQEELFSFFTRNSEEFLEIQANLSEAWSRFWELLDFN